MRRPATSIAVPFAGLLVLGTACAVERQAGAASESQADTTDDLADAREVVAMLGGDDGKCNDCHGVTAIKVRSWGNTMKAIDDACFVAPLTDAERVDCLRVTPTDPASAFNPRRLGLYAAGAATDQFAELFAAAFPGDPHPYATFKTKAGMPRGRGTPFTNEEFAKIKAWVLRGMPQLDEAFGGGDAGATAAR
jgi:hypothetical protein